MSNLHGTDWTEPGQGATNHGGDYRCRLHGRLVVNDSCPECAILKLEKREPGTDWCEPGEGATVKEVCLALIRHSRGSMDSVAGRAPISRFVGIHDDKRTNLRLTGRPLVAYDLERIAACEVAR